MEISALLAGYGAVRWAWLLTPVPAGSRSQRFVGTNAEPSEVDVQAPRALQFESANRGSWTRPQIWPVGLLGGVHTHSVVRRGSDVGHRKRFEHLRVQRYRTEAFY